MTYGKDWSGSGTLVLTCGKEWSGSGTLVLTYGKKWSGGLCVWVLSLDIGRNGRVVCVWDFCLDIWEGLVE